MSAQRLHSRAASSRGNARSWEDYRIRNWQWHLGDFEGWGRGWSDDPAEGSADTRRRRQRKKTACERRTQRMRAEARLVQKLLAVFSCLAGHRGCQLSKGGAIFAATLAVAQTPAAVVAAEASGNIAVPAEKAPPTRPQQEEPTFDDRGPPAPEPSPPETLSAGQVVAAPDAVA